MAKIFRFLLSTFLFLTPLLFWTFTNNSFATPKQFFLIVITAFMLLSWALPILTRRQLSFVRSPLNLPLALLGLGIILNLFFIPEARPEALVGRGSLYLALLILTYLVSLKNTPRLQFFSLIAFISATTLLALHGILQLTFLHSLQFLPPFMQTRSFTPAGNPLTTLTLLFLGITGSIAWVTQLKPSLSRNLLFFSTALQTIAFVAYFSLMLPGHELTPALLPLRASWSVALDALKSSRSLLLGVGLANFSGFFTTVKPLYLNSGTLWNFLPDSSGSEALQLLTTGGLVLFLPFFLLTLTPLRSLRHHPHPSPETLPWLILSATALLLLFLTPASIPLLVVCFVALALSTPVFPTTLTLPRPSNLLVFLTITLFTGASLFYTTKLALAEYHLHRAQIAFNQNDAQTVYQQHLLALRLAPSLANYHLSYSQVNLSLAAALSQRNNLSEEDRTKVTQLVSQAIQHAKLATTLRPGLANTWVNLSSVYRNLINVANGAENFAIQYLAQALQLDPGNPTLRVNLGGLFYQLANTASDPETATQYLDRALSEFTTATQLKPDYANAWYNLAKAFELAKNYPAAYSALQQTIAALAPDSPDLATATAELETVRGQLPSPSPSPSPAPTPTQSSAITEPSPLPSPLPGGPIALPNNSTSSAQ